MKFRKKPVVIEAICFTGTFSYVDMCEQWGEDFEEVSSHTAPTCLVIKTLEGEMFAGHGDWIIKGVKGEFYPCEPDIFKATYEKVES